MSNNYTKSIEKLRDKLHVFKIVDRAEFYCIKITELLLIQLDIRTGIEFSEWRTETI
jgi:hypothetical protein